MKKLTVEYDSRNEFQHDEDLRLKGLAFDRLDDYLKKIIRNGGASGVLASLSLDYNMREAAAEDLLYKLTEHYRKHLNSIYKDT